MSPESSHVVLEFIKRRVEVVNHLDLTFENIPRQLPAPLWNLGEHCHGLTNVFARRSPLDQAREATLGVIHTHNSGHEAILAWWGSDSPAECAGQRWAGETARRDRPTCSCHP